MEDFFTKREYDHYTEYVRLSKYSDRIDLDLEDGDGMGSYSLAPQEADRLIAWLIEARGHRLVDAEYYYNTLIMYHNDVFGYANDTLLKQETNEDQERTLARLRGENE